MSNNEDLERLLKLTSEEQQPKRKAGPGRPAGALNKFTRELKEAMLSAAEQSIHGKDPDNLDAPGSLTQFMIHVANRYPDKFAQFLTKFIPQQYHALKTEVRAEVTYQSTDVVKAALEEAGLTLKQIETLEGMLPTTVPDNDDGDSEHE
jgi:hypothetical protein